MIRGALAAGTVVALVAVGCGGDGGPSRGEALTIYVSAPLHGPRAAAGIGIERGARLALGDAGARAGQLKVRSVYLDDTAGGGWSIARTAANARRAAEDSSTIGYIGELDSGATRVSLPITNRAGIAQVSPGSSSVDLTRLSPAGGADPDRYRPGGERSFARVVPADDVQARAAAAWARRAGANGIEVLNDATTYGRTVADAFVQAARGFALHPRTLRGRVGFATARRVTASRSGAIFFGGSAAAAVQPLRLLAPAVPAATIFGPDALIDPAFLRGAAAFQDRLRLTSPFLDPSLLPARGRRFVRAYASRFGGHPAPAAAYGYESMALLLDAIRRAGAGGDDRGKVIDALLSTSDRGSVLGTYSIDGNGDTTLDTVSGYRISDGLPVFPVRLRARR